MAAKEAPATISRTAPAGRGGEAGRKNPPGGGGTDPSPPADKTKFGEAITSARLAQVERAVNNKTPPSVGRTTHSYPGGFQVAREIKQGDNLTSIARANGADPAKTRDLNAQFSNPDVIHPSTDPARSPNNPNRTPDKLQEVALTVAPNPEGVTDDSVRAANGAVNTNIRQVLEQGGGPITPDQASEKLSSWQSYQDSFRRDLDRQTSALTIAPTGDRAQDDRLLAGRKQDVVGRMIREMDGMATDNDGGINLRDRSLAAAKGIVSDEAIGAIAASLQTPT